MGGGGGGSGSGSGGSASRTASLRRVYEAVAYRSTQGCGSCAVAKLRLRINRGAWQHGALREHHLPPGAGQLVPCQSVRYSRSCISSGRRRSPGPTVATGAAMNIAALWLQTRGRWAGAPRHTYRRRPGTRWGCRWGGRSRWVLWLASGVKQRRLAGPERFEVPANRCSVHHLGGCAVTVDLTRCGVRRAAAWCATSPPGEPSAGRGPRRRRCVVATAACPPRECRACRSRYGW